MRTANTTKCLGVTVAVGAPYDDIAPLAASCFTKHTGIPTVVLGEQELASSELPHAAALRLLAFDYVAADKIVYFDADWFCLRPWCPFSGKDTDIRACRDFVLQNESPLQRYNFDSPDFLLEPKREICDGHDNLRHDYIREIENFASLGLPVSQWINSGLLVLDRQHHSIWLEKALELYLGDVGHHPRYFEQPALVKALECLNLRVQLLPRCFNVLARMETKWPSSVIGLHVKIKEQPTFLSQLQAGTIRTPEDVSHYFCAV